MVRSEYIIFPLVLHRIPSTLLACSMEVSIIPTSFPVAFCRRSSPNSNFRESRTAVVNKRARAETETRHTWWTKPIDHPISSPINHPLPFTGCSCYTFICIPHRRRPPRRPDAKCHSSSRVVAGFLAPESFSRPDCLLSFLNDRQRTPSNQFQWFACV